MKKLILITLFLFAGLFVSAQYDVKNQLMRQIYKVDTTIWRIYPTYDYINSSNPYLLNAYDSVGFSGILKTNTISPYSGTTTNFPQNLQIRKNLYLDTCSSVNYGVIYKGGVAWMHDYRPLTWGNTNLANRPIGSNIFIGINAGNFTLGSTAITSNLSSYNIGIGQESCKSLTTGNGNVGIGYRSLFSCTVGQFNTSIGYESLASNIANQNTGVGYQSLYLNAAGTNNTALGLLSGKYVGSGTTGNTTSDNCIYLGYDVRGGADNNQYEVVIGASAIGSGSNTVTLGNKDNTTWQTTRMTTANTAGTNLLIQNGGATVGATDKGTMISLGYGPTTGTGTGSVRLFRRDRAASTGTSDNTTSDAFIITSANNLTDNVAKGLFEVAVGTDGFATGIIGFGIGVTDGDSTQTYSGIVQYTCQDVNGTILTTISEIPALPGNNPIGMTPIATTWTAVVAAGKVTLTVVSNNAITGETSHKIYYTITNNSMSAITQL